MIVFCFWISHVPDTPLGAFLDKVSAAVSDGGVVFFADNRRDSTSAAVDHTLPPDGEELAERRLNDGRRFTIVKRHRTMDGLTEYFRAAGFAATITETPTYFQHGTARRSP